MFSWSEQWTNVVVEKQNTKITNRENREIYCKYHVIIVPVQKVLVISKYENWISFINKNKENSISLKSFAETLRAFSVLMQN